MDVVPSISALHRSFANGGCCYFSFPTWNYSRGSVLTQCSQSLAWMSCAGMGRGGEEKGESGRTGKGINGKDLLGARQIQVQLQEIFKLCQNSGLIIDPTIHVGLGPITYNSLNEQHIVWVIAPVDF